MGSVFAAPFSALEFRAEPAAGEAFGRAARMIAARFVAASGAAGAMIAIDGERLCESGHLPADEAPPPRSFLLASERGADGAEWRPGERGWWLCLDGLEQATLSLFAHFDERPVGGCSLAAGLAEAGLEALAAGLNTGRMTARRHAILEAALDGSELCILLLDHDGTLVFANRTGNEMLDAGDYLRRNGGGIAARDLGSAIRLEVAIDHVCSGEAETPVVAIKRRHPQRPLLVCISSADSGAVLRVIDPDRDVQSQLVPVCALYRLSPVETRLACQIAQGATLEEAAAAALRIKPQTARSYLKQIFLKTDSNRQPELVRVLLSSAVRALPEGRFRIV